jgi:hypothetical protein
MQIYLAENYHAFSRYLLIVAPMLNFNRAVNWFRSVMRLFHYMNQYFSSFFLVYQYKD